MAATFPANPLIAVLSGCECLLWPEMGDALSNAAVWTTVMASVKFQFHGSGYWSPEDGWRLWFGGRIPPLEQSQQGPRYMMVLKMVLPDWRRKRHSDGEAWSHDWLCKICILRVKTLLVCRRLVCNVLCWSSFRTKHGSVKSVIICSHVWFLRFS